MKRWKALLLVLFAVAIAAAIYGAVLIRHGFSATEEPSTSATCANCLPAKNCHSHDRQVQNPKFLHVPSRA